MQVTQGASIRQLATAAPAVYGEVIPDMKTAAEVKKMTKDQLNAELDRVAPALPPAARRELFQLRNSMTEMIQKATLPVRAPPSTALAHRGCYVLTLRHATTHSQHTPRQHCDCKRVHVLGAASRIGQRKLNTRYRCIFALRVAMLVLHPSTAKDKASRRT